MASPANEDGWEVQSGFAPFENEGNKGIAMLVTISGFGKMVNVLIVTNTQGYEQNINAFLESVSLKKPVGEIGGAPSTAAGATAAGEVTAGRRLCLYSYSGPFNANGTGTYTISLPDGIGKPGTMTGGGAGEITGDKVDTGSGVEKYTLTPIEPCR